MTEDQIGPQRRVSPQLSLTGDDAALTPVSRAIS